MLSRNHGMCAMVYRICAAVTMLSETSWSAAADNDDFAVLENGKKPASNGHESPKRKTPISRQPPAGNGFVDIDPEEAAKQN